MHKKVLNKRIPTLLGMMFLVVSVITTSVIVRVGFRNLIHAAPQVEPQGVLITNITPTSFSVAYVTQDSVIGTIGYSTDTSFTNIGFDDRDRQAATPQPHTVHNITVSNLTPKTTYHFRILSNGQVYIKNGNPYTLRIPEAAHTIASNPVMAGSVLQPGGGSGEALVFVSTSASQTLSTLTKPDGTYSLSLKDLLTSDLTDGVTLSDTAVITVRVISSTASSTANVIASQAGAVPVMTLSQNYDFSQTSPLLQSETASSSSQSAAPFPVLSGTPQKNSGPQILSPQKDAGFNDAQPLFKGTGQPNEKVDIVIHSDQTIQAQVTTDANGNWSYRPKTALSAGKHVISITTKDALGVLKTIQQSFTVFAAGSQFVNPSVSPIQTTPTVTLAPTVQPTATPLVTQAVVQTATPTIAPTTTVAPTPTIIVTPTPILPTATPAPLQKFKTGNGIVASGIIASVMAIVIGAVIFFLTRGTISL